MLVIEHVPCDSNYSVAPTPTAVQWGHSKPKMIAAPDVDWMASSAVLLVASYDINSCWLAFVLCIL